MKTAAEYIEALEARAMAHRFRVATLYLEAEHARGWRNRVAAWWWARQVRAADRQLVQITRLKMTDLRRATPGTGTLQDRRPK